MTVTTTVVPFGESAFAVAEVISIPATSLPLSPVQPFFACVNVTSSEAVLPSSDSVTSPDASFVNTDDEHSAYAALIFARSVASLDFSSCDVKIGICMSTVP